MLNASGASSGRKIFRDATVFARIAGSIFKPLPIYSKNGPRFTNGQTAGLAWYKSARKDFLNATKTDQKLFPCTRYPVGAARGGGPGHCHRAFLCRDAAMIIYLFYILWIVGLASYGIFVILTNG